MSTNPETKRRLRAVRRLAVSYPDRTATDRLAQIAGIASGETEPVISRPPPSPDLMERVEEGQRSRAKGNAFDRREREAEKEKEAARKKRHTRDRKQTGGRDRGA